MRSSFLSLREIVAAIRRRIWLLITPPVLLSGAGLVAALMAVRMYESSTTILIQKAEVVNPLASLASAMTQVDDPLRSFDQIIYSQRTIRQLIDSLGIDSTAHNEIERRMLFGEVRKNISTRINARESFSITFYDTDPHRAQRGASLLATIFIKTITDARDRKNQMTVEFYQEKLEEFGRKFEESQKELVERLRARNRELPGAAQTLNTRLESVDNQIDELTARNRDLTSRLSTLRRYPDALAQADGRKDLYDLIRVGIPYAEDLRPVLARYEDLTKRYSNEHPSVVAARNEIVQVIDRMKATMTAEQRRENQQLADLRKTRASIVDAMMQSSVMAETDRGEESNVVIYQRLYNEMKVKLEEAEMSRAIGEYAEASYTILDYPLVPLFPSRPSRVMIIGGALALGVVLGIISLIVAEIVDTTIRTPRQIELYRKPILALLPEGKEHKPA